MKKIDFTGWKDVYSFTLAQTLKSKSYRITLLIMCIIAAAVMPVMYYINGADEKNDTSGNKNGIESSASTTDTTDKEDVSIKYLKTLYVNYDTSDTGIADVISTCSDMYKCDIKYLDTEDIKKVSDKINDNKYDCIVVIDKSKGYYQVNATTSWDFEDVMNDVDKITNTMTAMLQDIQVKSVISDDNIKDAKKEVVGYVDNDENGYSEDINMNKYIFQMGIITILIFIMTFSGESIASSIVTEKSCKLVEFLMTSIKPMAIVAGKVLAVLTTVLIQFLSMGASAVLVGVLLTNMADAPVMSSFADTLESMGSQGMFDNLSPLLIIVIILVVLGGFLFFALLASLAGAACSKLEEMSEGIVLFTFVLIIGGYMGIALAMQQMMDSSADPGLFGMICYMLPISSMFSIPESMLFGDVTLWIACISMIIEYTCVVLLLMLTSKIYEYLLFYNGATLKPKDIIYIAIHGQKKEAK